MTRTRSELVFERFCRLNGLGYLRLEEGSDPTPDYKLLMPTGAVFVEVKQIESNVPFVRETATSAAIGSRLREKTRSARRQLARASEHSPTMLVVLNAWDPLQLYSTDHHDFVAGMYGDMTLLHRGGRATGLYYGDNGAIREDRNTSLSAVGYMREGAGDVWVTLYENVFARTPLSFETFPSCFDVRRVCIERAEAEPVVAPADSPAAASRRQVKGGRVGLNVLRHIEARVFSENIKTVSCSVFKTT